MGQGGRAGPESVSSHWQGLPQGQAQPREPAESLEGSRSGSELSNRQRQGEQQQWAPVPSAAEHGARLQASSGAVSSRSGANNASAAPTPHGEQLGAGVQASIAPGSRPGQQQPAPPRNAVLDRSQAGPWTPGEGSSSRQADSRRPQPWVAASSSSTPLQASDAWFLNPAYSGAAREHQEVQTHLPQPHSAAADAGDVSVLPAGPQDGDGMRQQGPGMQDVKAPVPSAQVSGKHSCASPWCWGSDSMRTVNCSGSGCCDCLLVRGSALWRCHSRDWLHLLCWSGKPSAAAQKLWNAWPSGCRTAGTCKRMSRKRGNPT